MNLSKKSPIGCKAESLGTAASDRRAQVAEAQVAPKKLVDEGQFNAILFTRRMYDVYYIYIYTYVYV